MLSSNDDVQWEDFGKEILQDNIKKKKDKMQSSKYLSRKDRSPDDNTINRESTTVAGDQINNDNKVHEKFENVDYLHKPCHQIKWNVVNENSNTLILTVELQSKESICSLSNADLRVAYPHLCQYGKYKSIISSSNFFSSDLVLDRGVYNNRFGKHGHFVNNQSGFNCECSFLYEGSSCEKCKRYVD